jgi:hypothetical protein
MASARLAFVPAEWLMLVARRWMFAEVPYNRNNTWKHFITVVQSAARCEEGAWLLDKIGGGDRKSPDYGRDVFFERSMMVYCITSNDESPRAKYYRGRALLRATQGMSRKGKKLLDQAEAAGFISEQDALHWQWITGKGADCLFKAAAQGHVQSMGVLSGLMCVRKDALLFMARYVFLTADWEKYDKEYELVEDQFVIGRELQGYEEFWDEGHHPGPRFIRCIDVYLSVTKKARLAALCTVWALYHHRRLGKDVAKFIGKIVYGTRLANPDAWI